MGKGTGPGTLCTLCLLTKDARQLFWEPEPHPVNQSSQYPRGYFLEILPLLMLNCPLGCQQQSMVLGVGLGCTGAPGMDPSAAFSSWREDGSCCLVVTVWLLFVQKDVPVPLFYTKHDGLHNWTCR